MTLERLFAISNTFNEIYTKHNFKGQFAQLKNVLITLNSFRLQQGSASAMQNYNTQRNTINALKSTFTPVLNLVVNDLKATPYWNEYYNDLVGDEFSNLIDVLNSNIHPSDDDLFNSLIKSFDGIEQLINFNIAVKDIKDTAHINLDFINRDLVTVIFEGEAYFDDLKGLSKVSDDWNIIVYCIARLVNESDTKAEILSVTKGSTIMDIATDATIAIAIGKSSNYILEALQKVLNIKKTTLELKKLTADTVNAELDSIEKKSNLKSKALTDEITQKLMDEYQQNKEKDDYNEIANAVKKALRKLITFQSKGGKIEPKLANPTQINNDLVAQLRESNRVIRDLQKTILALADGEPILLLEENNEDEDNVQD